MERTPEVVNMDGPPYSNDRFSNKRSNSRETIPIETDKEKVSIEEGGAPSGVDGLICTKYAVDTS